MRRQILRPRVAHSDRRVALQQQERGGFADQVAPTDHDRVRAFDPDARTLEQQHDAGRRARFHAAGQPEGDQPRVDGMEAVDVLHRVECQHHLPHVDLLGRRLLNEDRTHGLVTVQCLDQSQQLFGGGTRGEPVILRLDADATGVALLQRDVHRGGRVVTDEHVREPRPRRST